jgi:predicted nucleic acid-binding protein
MILIDTSVWIEFLKARSPYYDGVLELLEENRVLALSCIFGELLQGAKNKRERGIIQDLWTYLPKTDERHLFVRAGLESGIKKWTDKGVGLIDSAIISSARQAKAEIWTLDKKMQSILKPTELYRVIEG